MTAPTVSLRELASSAHVVRVPLTEPFRGLDYREAVLFRGPCGWAEFSPFSDYDDDAAAPWLAAAIEFAYTDTAENLCERERVPVNATVPAVPAGDVASIVARYHGARCVKVKVAGPGSGLADDVARVRAAREALGPGGKIRIDANGAWQVPEALAAIAALEPFDLEYIEQPCATVPELAELRAALGGRVAIAADESVRRADDPLAVVRAGAADRIIIKVAPLGGIERAHAVARESGLPVTVSSALETSVGLAAGLYLAASLPETEAGLATAHLLAADVSSVPLLVRDGAITVRRVAPNAHLLERWAVEIAARDAWIDRMARCLERLG